MYDFPTVNPESSAQFILKRTSVFNIDWSKTNCKLFWATVCGEIIIVLTIIEVRERLCSEIQLASTKSNWTRWLRRTTFELISERDRRNSTFFPISWSARWLNCFKDNLAAQKNQFNCERFYTHLYLIRNDSRATSLYILQLTGMELVAWRCKSDFTASFAVQSSARVRQRATKHSIFFSSN